MAYINDNVFDSGLAYAQTNGTRLDILSAEPSANDYATVIALTLGNKTGLTTGAPQAGTTDGRKVQVPAITDGSVTATDDATHWAVTNGTAIVVAWGILNGSQAVTDTNTFTLDAIDITLRDDT